MMQKLIPITLSIFTVISLLAVCTEKVTKEPTPEPEWGTILKLLYEIY